MSRSGIKILSLLLFLFWALFPSPLPRYESRFAVSLSMLPDYRGGIKILPPAARKSYGYGEHMEAPSFTLDQRRAASIRSLRRAVPPEEEDNGSPLSGRNENRRVYQAGAEYTLVHPHPSSPLKGEIYLLNQEPDLVRTDLLKTDSRTAVLNRFGRIFPFLRQPAPADDGSGPVIQSISPGSPGSSGYAQTAAVLTLKGKRLSAQSSQDWIHFNESQGSFEDTTGWKRQANCWVRDNWECWAPTAVKRDDDVTFDPRVAILGNQSYRNNIHYTQNDWKYARECPGKGEFYNLTWWDAPDADQYYYRFYVRYSGPAFQWTDNSWKQLYVHNLFNLNPCMWDNPPTSRGPARYDIQGQTRVFAHLPDTLALERWYCLEIWVKKAGCGVNLKFWLDGEECGIYDEHDQAPQQFPWSKCYQGKNQQLTFGSLELGTTNCQNWKYKQLPVKQSIWFDGFAMSATRIYPAALVEIGNQSDYTKAKKIKQEILHLSDTQIQFRVNTAGLERGPYYVWVTNNQQARSNACSLRVRN